MNIKKLASTLVRLSVAAVLLSAVFMQASAAAPLKLLDFENLAVGTAWPEAASANDNGYIYYGGKATIADFKNRINGKTSRVLEFTKKQSQPDPLLNMNVTNQNWSSYKDGYIVMYLDGSNLETEQVQIRVGLTTNDSGTKEDYHGVIAREDGQDESEWTVQNWSYICDGSKLSPTPNWCGYITVTNATKNYYAFKIKTLDGSFDTTKHTVTQISMATNASMPRTGSVIIDDVFLANSLSYSGGELVADGIKVTALFGAAQPQASSQPAKVSSTPAVSSRQQASQQVSAAASAAESIEASSTEEETESVTEKSSAALVNSESPISSNTQAPKSGLSGGTIALIVAGAVAVLGGGGAALYFFVIKKKPQV